MTEVRDEHRRQERLADPPTGPEAGRARVLPGRQSQAVVDEHSNFGDAEDLDTVPGDYRPPRTLALALFVAVTLWGLILWLLERMLL